MDLLVVCDRSDGQYDSSAKRCADQLNGARIVARLVVTTVHLQCSIANPHLSLACLIVHSDEVAHPTSTLSQSSMVTPGVSTLPLP